MAESHSPATEVKIVPTGSRYDCGGLCIHKVHVKDGVVIRVETDNGEEPQLRSCSRGRAYRRQLYSPDRLRFPQNRVGPRGEGQFMRISWDEALDTVAGELLRVKETYGTKAILEITLSDGVGSLHTGPTTIVQLMSGFDGNTTFRGDAPAEGGVFAARWVPIKPGTDTDLMARGRTGQGQYIYISFLDYAISLQTLEASLYFAMGVLPKRGKTWFTGVAPFYNTYKTKDGKYISIGCLEPHFWQNFCQELGKPEYIPFQFSDDKYDEMFSFFRKTFLTRNRDEWFKLLSGKNIPVTPVYDLDEVFSDPQVLHRQMLVEVDHPGFGKVKQVGVPIKLSHTQGQVRSLGANPGTHANEILSGLGYSPDEIESLRKSGALG